MGSLRWSAGCVLACTSVLFAAPAAPAATRLLVQFRAGAAHGPALSAVRAGDVHRVGRLRVFSLDAAAPHALALLRAARAVRWAEPDARLRALDVPVTDPFAGPAYNWWLPQLRIPRAWSTTMGAATTVVGVVDSGVAPTQPDLAGALLPGYDFVDDDTDTSDANGHGTAVAGLIAARANNGIGAAGGCPRCSILPVRVIGADGTGAVSAMARGIVWAADHGARVINVSIKAAAQSPTLDAAVSYAIAKGAVVVAGAGNDGSADRGYPAASPGAIGVAATTSTDARYPWSSYGSWVDVAAPGCTASTGIGGATVSFCGTSAAAPVVSSVAALLVSRNPTAQPAQIETALESTAQPVGDFVRYGRVDAAAAVESLAPPTATPGPTPEPPAGPTPVPTVGGSVAPTITATVPARLHVTRRTSLAFAVFASAAGKLHVELAGAGVDRVVGLRPGSNPIAIRLPGGLHAGTYTLTLTSASTSGVAGTALQRRLRLWR